MLISEPGCLFLISVLSTKMLLCVKYLSTGKIKPSTEKPKKETPMKLHNIYFVKTKIYFYIYVFHPNEPLELNMYVLKQIIPRALAVSHISFLLVHCFQL